MDAMRGLDAWIEGRHMTHDPRSPYYNGPECECDFEDTGVHEQDCPVAVAERAADDEPDADDLRDRAFDDDMREEW